MPRVVKNITVYDRSELPDFGPGFEGYKAFCNWLHVNNCTIMSVPDDEDPEKSLKSAIKAARCQECEAVVIERLPRSKFAVSGQCITRQRNLGP